MSSQGLLKQPRSQLALHSVGNLAAGWCQEGFMNIIPIILISNGHEVDDMASRHPIGIQFMTRQTSSKLHMSVNPWTYSTEARHP